MKILIVDDNVLLLYRLEQAILKMDPGIEIVKADSCAGAYGILLMTKPDLVILDISLPDGSGIDVLRMIRKQYPHVPVFMFTSYPTDEFKRSCLELGADSFFEKTNFHGLMESISLHHNAKLDLKN